MRSKDWSQRIKYELEDKTKLGDFVTFTTDPKIAVGTQGFLLQKDELQRLFKRIRKHHKIKYYACGEYGEKHGRAHYHAIIIREANNPINYYDYWKQGQIDVGTVTPASIAYCTGYLLKANPVPHGIPQENIPFHIWSRGIGDNYMKNKTHIEMAREGNIPRRWRALADEKELPLQKWKKAQDTIKGWETNGRYKEQVAYEDKTRSK